MLNNNIVNPFTPRYSPFKSIKATGPGDPLVLSSYKSEIFIYTLLSDLFSCQQNFLLLIYAAISDHYFDSNSVLAQSLLKHHQMLSPSSSYGNNQ